MNWPPGTIVVCVDDRPLNPHLNPPNPVIGQALLRGSYYTVRTTAEAWQFTDDRAPAVWLKENRRRGYYSGEIIDDFPWGKRRFRIAESAHSEAGSVRQSTEAR